MGQFRDLLEAKITFLYDDNDEDFPIIQAYLGSTTLARIDIDKSIDRLNFGEIRKKLSSLSSDKIIELSKDKKDHSFKEIMKLK